MTFLWVALGGAVGAACRYGVTIAAQRLTGGAFPLGTFLVNVTGCLTIGFLGYLFAGPLPVREDLRIFLLVGFLGGFTTFSSFGYDTLTLWQDEMRWQAYTYVLATNILGLTAVWAGYRLAARLWAS